MADRAGGDAGRCFLGTMTMRIYLAMLIAAAMATFGIGLSAQTDSAEPPRPVVGRSVVMTTYGIVAASQPLAARAGVQA